MKKLIVGDPTTELVAIGKGLPLVLIGGPCVIESLEHSLRMADTIAEICTRLSIPYIFKSCYDKDCRSSIKSFHGHGIEKGLEILAKVRTRIGVPVTTDFSIPEWAEATGKVVDLIQIPAYLCRQTQMLKAAGYTGKPINIKKGQFMSPWNMKNSVNKIIDSTGNNQIMLTERGTFFGYNALINDYRSLPIMQDIGFPVCYDATHSIQLPTSQGQVSGGEREFIPSLVRAAAASGIQALFMEIHDNPNEALSDPATQLDIKYLEGILRQAREHHSLRNEFLESYGEDNVE